MTWEVPDLLSAYFTLHVSSWKRKIKYAFIPSLQTKVLRFSLMGPSQITKPINVVRGRNALSHWVPNPKLEGLKSNSSDSMNSFQCQGLLGRKGKTDSSEATSVSEHTASVLHHIITSFSHWLSDIQSLGLLPLPNTLLLTATNAPYLNSLYTPRGIKIFF